VPEVRDVKAAEVVFLYTEIGRGHPSYLDGIIDTLRHNYPDVAYYENDVFGLSHGCPLVGWKMVRRLYQLGGRGGVVSKAYGKFRRVMKGGGTGGMTRAFLGRNVRKALADYGGPVVVAHPMLAGMLSKQAQVIYQHGELAAPAESIIPGCYRILVPLESTAAVFKGAGIPDKTLLVSGQCLEIDLVPLAERAYRARLERLSGGAPLTAAFFSSGAYPRDHLTKLRLAAVSAYHQGIAVIFFSGRSQKVARSFTDYFERQGMAVVTDIAGTGRLKVISSSDRHEENRKVASIFEKLDFFVGPAHERTNWSVGLGLPQFILTPHIGSYAPINAVLAVEQGGAAEIYDDAAAEFGRLVAHLQAEGKLKRMAENGFEKWPRNGFEACTRFVAQAAGRKPTAEA